MVGLVDWIRRAFVYLMKTMIKKSRKFLQSRIKIWRYFARAIFPIPKNIQNSKRLLNNKLFFHR